MEQVPYTSHLPLEGRLEAVLVRNPDPRRSSYGRIIHNDRTVLVQPHAPSYQEKLWLVRFHLRQSSPRGPMGRVVTSRGIPSDFPGYAAAEYVLCGLWEPRMKKRGTYPTLLEIDKYFNPGDAKLVFFFPQTQYRYQGRVLITPDWALTREVSTSSIIRRRLPDPKEAARVILVETQPQLQELIDAVYDHTLTPVIMEPLQ